MVRDSPLSTCCVLYLLYVYLCMGIYIFCTVVVSIGKGNLSSACSMHYWHLKEADIRCASTVSHGSIHSSVHTLIIYMLHSSYNTLQSDASMFVRSPYSYYLCLEVRICCKIVCSYLLYSSYSMLHTNIYMYIHTYV